MKNDFNWCAKHLLDMHAKANVGHVGGNLSCLAGICAIMDRLRRQDRFVLSKGHSAGALYVALARAGILPETELDTFHKDGTRLPGHPPANMFDAIPFATGSLGHGLSLAAGFALSQMLRNDNAKTYCLTSDGEWQEGSTWEALIFACHHQLKNLTIVIDHNGLQGFGTTATVASMDPLWGLFKGFDIEVVVLDGHDLDAVDRELDRPQDRVRALILRTIKGKGVPGMEGTLHSHYLPMTDEQHRSAIAKLDAGT
ncbi:MAG: 1-deoxy-D-xylulose-5-phosphate synthase N-terminal domain-containing protein [Pseudomonadota bacterium]